MPDASKPHISSQFDLGLDKLRANVLMMSSLTERSLTNAQAGLLQKDAERCNSVIADDDEIDILEKEVSSDAIGLILRFQPVALDLRVVVATMKISVNLERIADQAVNIARRARKLLHWTPLPEVDILASLFVGCRKFHQQVVEAFVNHQALSPNRLEIAHATLMSRTQAYGDAVAERMPYALDQAINACMELVHIAKALEQVAGICRDIGTDTQYAFNPDFVRLGQKPEDAEPEVEE